MTYVFFDPDFEGPNNLRLSLTFALTPMHSSSPRACREQKVSKYPRWESNPQSSDPESDALSIRPRGRGNRYIAAGSKYEPLRGALSQEK